MQWANRQVLLVGIVLWCAVSRAAEDERALFFENEVRPLLAQRCYSCHGPRKQESGLRLDSRHAVSRGGRGGAVVV
ncbi:MAG: hypothetical protein MK364_17200, partial [Pirellulales bacterium]|nr:hypothetical protein [Pirellulales bacterium]